MAKSDDTLVWAMQMLGRSQGKLIDMQKLVLAIRDVPESQDKLRWLEQVLEHAAGPTPVRVSTPQVAELPLLQHDPVLGWTVLVAIKPDGHWEAASPEGMKVMPAAYRPGQLTVLLNWPLADAVGHGFRDKLEAGLRAARSDVLEAGLGSAFIQLLALITSMFSMQVYDRVIPGKGMSTLLVLTSGVLLTIGLELVMKTARGRLMEHVVTGLDSRLSQDIFERLLSIRLDQLPASLGSLASQLRAYESVRSHYAASTLFAFIDMPMGLFLLMAMALIGHPVVVVVPMLLGAVSVATGLLLRQRLEAQAQAGARHAHRKLGLLVETVEGMETLKAASGGAWQQSRWLTLSRETLRNELAGRSTTEMTAHAMAALQQLGYVSVVATGAWAVMNGHMTTGALVACSILAGRVLSPLVAWPGLLLQKAHAQAALEGLDRLYRLQTDQNAGLALQPARLRGDFHVEEAKFAYHDHPCVLHIPNLHIRAGERLALIGPIGSGKSTLLKLLAGLYQPQQGKVLIDGLDMSHIHRQVVSRHVGYLQQNHRLLQGTLRENLLLGIPDPGDEAMLDAIRRTGFDRVVAAHPLGLERPISEGGQGLSGGQKQLLAFTRLVLCAPDIWLLDEPTAAMDETQAQQCLDVLAQEVRAGKTMVLVTHKTAALQLADRLMVMAQGRMVLDGPRKDVLERLRQIQTV